MDLICCRSCLTQASQKPRNTESPKVKSPNKKVLLWKGANGQLKTLKTSLTNLKTALSKPLGMSLSVNITEVDIEYFLNRP